MIPARIVLAEKYGFGSIYQCPEGCYHLQIGPMNLRLNREAYFDLVDMVSTSAATYESAHGRCDASLSAGD